MNWLLTHCATEAFCSALQRDSVVQSTWLYCPDFLQSQSMYKQLILSCLSMALCCAAGSRGLPLNVPYYQADNDVAMAETVVRRH